MTARLDKLLRRLAATRLAAVVYAMARSPLRRHRIRRAVRGTVRSGGLLWAPIVGTMRPSDARQANADLVIGRLDASGVPYTVVRTVALNTTVAVPIEHRADLIRHMALQWAEEPVYVQLLAGDDALDPDGSRSMAFRRRWHRRARPVADAQRQMRSASVLRIGRLYRHHNGTLAYDMTHGCDLEFWARWAGADGYWVAPRPNVAARLLSDDDVTFRGRARRAPRVPSVFDRKMVDDVDFPIDVVYTWVDDADPAWREKLERHRRDAGMVHPQASAGERFRSRDELRYSLRSLSMYAPWVRHVYIVTDDQVPPFVDFESDGITLIDHTDIATDPNDLPVFNSNAIISWLHRIPGLSEHYLYMNDDVFFGRSVVPRQFFTPSGLCRVFPSRNQRPFGPPTPNDEPHINLTRNIRSLLEVEFGRTPSFSIRHAPHAQRISVHRELEERFCEALTRTSRNRFRHHDDVVADQLFHYYAQITGRAIAAGIRYGYVNIGDRRQTTELLGLPTRSLAVFCLNDAPYPGLPGIDDEHVAGVLESLYPIPSTFERSPVPPG